MKPIPRHFLHVSFIVFFIAIYTPAVPGDGIGGSIMESLTQSPPSVPTTSVRKQALLALDDWVSRPRSETDEAVVAYYQAAIDRAITKITTDPVPSGVRIVQLYSSSVLVQTPNTVFAFDLDRGPNPPSDDEPARFDLTREQVARLASLIEIAFHTHEHDDHIDPLITEALLLAGKTVVTTESNKAAFAQYPWAKQLQTLAQTVEHPLELGSLKVDVLWDSQWSDSLHTRGTPCNAYVVTTPEGVSVMTKGDINCGLQLYGWLSLLKQHGRQIDIFVGSPIYWRGVDVISEINELFSPLWLPGHAWEFGHRKAEQPKGNCAGFLQSWQIVHEATGSEHIQALSWGEWIDIPAKK